MPSTWIKFNSKLALMIERMENGAVVMKISQLDKIAGSFPDVPVDCEYVVDSDLAESIAKLMLGEREAHHPKYADDIQGPFHLLPVRGGQKLALHDKNGLVIPCQTDIKYDGPIRDVSTITVTFAVDGRFIRLGK